MTGSASTKGFYTHLTSQIEQVKEDGLYKAERIITTAQQPQIAVNTGEDVVNFCANNYLGLANHPELIAAAKTGTFYLWYARYSQNVRAGHQRVFRHGRHHFVLFLF